MPLSVGDKLGHYEILAPIGAGGMGEVYRARDPRLNRDVAIKVLQERFSDRFEREARAVAALNHPNICTLHDVGPNYLVMEFIEGEPPKGPLPFDEALLIARQIADALEAAHEKGIVHRDLKPANIKITPEGKVKVLDFGLAKAADPTPTASSDNSPTLTMRATQVGVILGTAAYMAPEQAAGKPVDRRADIWSFGVVLWELLAGKRLFDGESISQTLADVLRAPIDLEALPKDTPAAIRALVRQCLERDIRKRLQWIGDGRIAIEETLANPHPAPAAESPRRTSRVWFAVACAAVMVAVAGWLRSNPPGSQPPSMTLSIVPPSGTTFRPVGGIASAPEISPDGSAIMYEVAGLQLYTRRLDSLEARLIPGRVSNASFWSADSTTIVYPPSILQLMKVRLPDGAPEAVATLPGASRGGSWSDDGTILISAGTGWRLIPASGGEAKPVERPSLFQEGGWFYPEFLPGTQDFLSLFVPGRDPDDAGVYLASLRDGKVVDPVLILKNQTAARYTPAGGGRILFVRNDNLYSQKLNRRTRKLEGQAELAVSGVASQPSMTIRRADFSVARNGTLVWRPGKAALSQVIELDRRANQVATSGPPGSLDYLELSPDERQLLVASLEAGWLLEVGRSGRSELPKGVRWCGWFANGSKLIGFRLEDRAMVEMPASGLGDVHELPALRSPSLVLIGIPGISADGTEVVASGASGFFSFQLGGGPNAIGPKAVQGIGPQASGPRLSPDGRWLVYATAESGGGLYVQPFPGPGPRRQIAPGPAISPLWRRDGKEILYRSADTLMSVAVEWSGTLAFVTPRKLFDVRVPAGALNTSLPLAVSHDGSRIFWAQGVEQPDSNVIHVKTGAFDRLH